MEQSTEGSPPTASKKWTARQKSDSKRAVAAPTSDDYSEWTVDQLKLECTARKLSVAKNTKKEDRVTILRSYDTSKGGVTLLLDRQRLGKRASKSSEDARRIKHCIFRLINLLFSDIFFEAFISSGDQLTRQELDDGGSRFWEDVAAAFNTSNELFDGLVSPDSIFEGICPDQITVHSAAKLRSFWKEVSSKSAKAEANSKVSGGHNEFWSYCGGNTDVMYLHLWCEHRKAGREFYAGCVYEENEDDSTKEKNQTPNSKPKNRKRQKVHDPIVTLTEAVNKLVETESTIKVELIAEKTALARAQRIRIERDNKTEKLAALDGILIRLRSGLSGVDQQIYDRNMKGMPIAELNKEKDTLLRRIEKLQNKVDELEDEVIRS